MTIIEAKYTPRLVDNVQLLREKMGDFVTTQIKAIVGDGIGERGLPIERKSIATTDPKTGSTAIINAGILLNRTLSAGIAHLRTREGAELTMSQLESKNYRARITETDGKIFIDLFKRGKKKDISIPLLPQGEGWSSDISEACAEFNIPEP